MRVAVVLGEHPDGIADAQLGVDELTTTGCTEGLPDLFGAARAPVKVDGGGAVVDDQPRGDGVQIVVKLG